MVKYYKVLATSIDYSVEEEDLENSYYTEKEIKKAIRNIKKQLPQQLVVECECEFEELEEQIADAISEETSWSVNSFYYEILLTL